MLVSLLQLAVLGTALGEQFIINNSEDFVTFSNSVSNGGYNGTVVLGSDIDFGELSNISVFKPIGRDINNSFTGIFDGQGHVIRNISMSSDLMYVGLFGISVGVEIKSLVIDESCSFESTHSVANDNAWAASLIGNCAATNSVCNINNIINMGSVSFSGDLGDTGNNCYSFGGGIIADCTAKNHGCMISNCFNYGPIAWSGKSKSGVIGGIIGKINYENSNVAQGDIRNCLFDAAITYTGDSAEPPKIGGMVGSLSKDGKSNISECIVLGSFASKQPNKTGIFVGSVDNSDNSVPISNCFWDETINFNILGYGPTPTTSEVYSFDSEFILNDTAKNKLLEKMNSAMSSQGMKWAIVEFHCNGGTIPEASSGEEVVKKSVLVSSSGHAMKLPHPTKEDGEIFAGWFSDAELTARMTTSTPFGETSVLYAGWGTFYTITFDPNGGKFESSSSGESIAWNAKTGTSHSLPDVYKDGYTFTGWSTNDRISRNSDGTYTICDSDVLLVAQWKANNYTVTLNVNGGDALPVSASEFTVTYNQPYNCLPNATRTGHTFTGWFTKENGGIEVTNKTTANITADNHALYAQWTINIYTITFDFGNGTVDNEILTFNETIIYPMNLTRKGYNFTGWKPKSDRMPANDTTVVAQWNEVKESHDEIMEVVSDLVEVVLDVKNLTKDLSYEEIEKIIKGFTNGNFKIESIERIASTEEINVIIRFDDEQDAGEFVRIIERDAFSGGIIKRVTFIEARSDSASRVMLMYVVSALSMLFACL